VGDYLAFRRMITPAFIQIIFWLAVIGIIIGGIVSISHGRTGAGLALIILGPLGVRIYAELLIVIFGINDNVYAIRSAARAGEQAPPA
jgi:hypothetical protein